MIDINTLRILDLIDRLGSMSKAAEALDKVPSALSHAIAKIERKIGQPVIKLQGRNAVLIPAGQMILKEGRPLLESLENLQKKLTQFNSGTLGDITLGVDINLSPEPILQWMGKFAKSEIKMDCSLVQKSSAELIDDLENQRIQLMIGTSLDRQSLSSHINTRNLLTSPQLVLVGENYPFAGALIDLFSHDRHALHGHHHDKSMAALWKEIHWITLEHESAYDYPPQVRTWMKRKIRVTNSIAQWHAIQLGMGVGLFPQKLLGRSALDQSPDAIRDLLRPRRVRLLAEQPGWEVAYRAAWSNNGLDQGLRWFIRQLDNIYLRTSLIASPICDLEYASETQEVQA